MVQVHGTHIKTIDKNLPNFLFFSIFNYNSYRKTVHNEDANTVPIPTHYILSIQTII